MDARENDNDDYGAFTEKFQLLPPPRPSPSLLPLHGLTFAVKEIFDVAGYVTGFGNPDWAKTHKAAISTAPAVLAVIDAGATCIGKTVMDEMAYSINGENVHYGTPVNPSAPDRVPGGSSSGSAVAVAAKLVDFSLGTDTGGSVRVPASYCGIFGIRPSHGAISTSGVIPMAQSFDTVGWFARDPKTLSRVGCVLLPLPSSEIALPRTVIIADDCFQILSMQGDRILQIFTSSVKTLLGDHALRHENLGSYIGAEVPSLKTFSVEYPDDIPEHTVPSLSALSNAMRILQRCVLATILEEYRLIMAKCSGPFYEETNILMLERGGINEPNQSKLVYANEKTVEMVYWFEFQKTHKDWVRTVKPEIGSGIYERVWQAINATDENVDKCLLVRSEIQLALGTLLKDDAVLAIPTVPGPPPKLFADVTSLESFRAKAFCLLSIAGMSGFCQVTIPLGICGDFPVSISLVAKPGADHLLLSFTDTLYGAIVE